MRSPSRKPGNFHDRLSEAEAIWLEQFWGNSFMTSGQTSAFHFCRYYSEGHPQKPVRRDSFPKCHNRREPRLRWLSWHRRQGAPSQVTERSILKRKRDHCGDNLP